ncbi:type IV secretion system DNA-binding domain-containing protein [Frankia sp. Mgl5]|uniref:type IV secretory system conjugative DNA transfer family protein n=1 Tax=Frankia sp. Mgl5 TaxID=2933793 RepID=UPI00200F97F3|nr:TraM recognition domain-containing protein [Frankia sp. Mgl5]MCK9931101.1 type IV secretion system DNA-binding domain-containing protein [Frankia sp. Mgl5]
MIVAVSAPPPGLPPVPPPPPPPPAPELPGWLTDPDQILSGLQSWLAGHAGWWPLALLAVVLLLAAGYGRGRVRAHRHAVLLEGARTVEILTPPEVSAHAAEIFWGQMGGLQRPFWDRLFHGQPHLGWELLATRAGTVIQLWVPGPVPPGMVERAVQAAWPGARTTTRPASAPLPDYALAIGGQLRLAQVDVLPLRADTSGDPIRSLLSAASELDDDEAAVVQLLARPVTGRRLTLARRAAARQRGQYTPSLPGRALDLITPHAGPRPAPGQTVGTAGPTPPEDSAASRAMGLKAVGPRWEATVTYAAAHLAPPMTKTGQRAAVTMLRGRAHALASAFALYSGHNYLRRLRLPHPVPVLAARRLRRGDLLAVGELAALAHLPLDTAVPGLSRAGAAAVAPPAGIPEAGPRVKPLGESEAGRRRRVGLNVADARHHVHVVGATGSGKSTLLANMILADAEARRGLAVFDPKGDLVNDVLARLPADAADRVVLLDPEDPTAPPCLNILDGGDPDLATDQLVGIFRRIWADSWGPRTDDLLRATCLTLLERRTRTGILPTLEDVVKVLTDPDARRKATTGIADPILASFWEWYGQLSEGARAAAIGPILNKLRALLLRGFARQALAAGPSTVDLREVLDRGGILLVRIPKGVIGEDASRIVGSIVLAKIWQTVLHRARLHPDQRPDATCFLDEAQNFLTMPGAVEDMLAEARGYRLSMTLAHQHLRQLPDDLADALSTNARSKLFFGVSPKDAADLARHVSPVLTQHDLARLPAWTAAARLVVDQADTAAFTLRTRPLPPPVPGRAEALRVAARRHTAAPDAGRGPRPSEGSGR